MKLSNIQQFMAAFIILFIFSFTAQSQTVAKQSTQKASISESNSPTSTTPVNAEQKTIHTEKQTQSVSSRDSNKAKPSTKDCAKSKAAATRCCDKKKTTASTKECADKKKEPESSGDKK